MSEQLDCQIVDLSVFNHAPSPEDDTFPSAQQRAVAEEINKALRTNGFLMLRNLGIQQDLLQQMYQLSVQLFSPSISTKQQTLSLVNHSAGNLGYVPPHGEILNPSRVESKEAFNISFGCEQRQSFQDLSKCPQHFESTAKKFWDDIISCGVNKFSVALALAWNLPVHTFSSMLQHGKNATIRLLHYPPIQPSTDEMTIRAGEHTDFGLFTFLFTNSHGLQAQPVQGGELTNGQTGADSNWYHVPVPVGTDAVVNVGAMMARFTNDKWPAAAHRVVSTTSTNHIDRYSLVCFFDPSPDTIVKPILPPDNDSEKCRYGPITADEYLKRRLAELS